MAFPTDDLGGRWEARLDTGYSDDDPVTTATDQSGVGRDLTGGSPTYKTGILNGHAVYRFDGTDDVLDYVHGSSDVGNAQTITVVVSSGAAEATSRVWPLSVNRGSTSGIMAFTEGVVSGEWGTFHRTFDTGGDTVQQATSGVDTRDFTVLTLDWDGSTTRFYVDGALVNETSLGGDTDVQDVDMGAHLSQFFSGDVALAARWDASLGATGRAELHSYVQDTYGITVADYESDGPTYDETGRTVAAAAATAVDDTAAYSDSLEVTAAAATTVTDSLSTTIDETGRTAVATATTDVTDVLSAADSTSVDASVATVVTDTASLTDSTTVAVTAATTVTDTLTGVTFDPANAQVTIVGTTAQLTWDASPTEGVVDYWVFRRTPQTGAKFDPLVDTPAATGIEALEYDDADREPASYDTEVYGRIPG
jgi:hypothetical protein